MNIVTIPIKYAYGNNEIAIPIVNPMEAPIIVFNIFRGAEIITHALFPIAASAKPKIAHNKAPLYSVIG